MEYNSTGINQMKVSIITVCFNSAVTIQDSLASVAKQNYSDIEYIVVDGASTDNTLDLIANFEDTVSHLISEPDKGLYDAMNKGIQAATGDVIAILNSDDIYESDTVISDVVSSFEANPDADMIFGDVVFVKPDQMDVIIRLYNAANFKAWKLRFGWMPPHPATVIRKSAYDKTGLYSLGYKISADYEMFVRMLLVNKLKIVRFDKVLVRMRAGGVSTAGIRSTILLNNEIVKACRNNGVYTNILMVLSKVPFKLLEIIRKPSK